MMRTLWKDIQFGLRMMKKSPGFTLVAVISMALGIGANSTIFSLVDAALFKPFPVKDSHELVTVYSHTKNDPYSSVSYLDFRDYQKQNEVFTDLMAFNITAASVRFDDQTRFILGEIVSGNYFQTLGLQPFLGRSFLPEEDQTQNSHPVVVIGYEFWKNHWNGDPGVIDKTLKMNGREFTIIGVMSPEYKSLLRGFASDFWIPTMMHPTIGVGSEGFFSNRADRCLYLVGRLKPGMDKERAVASLAVQADQLAQAYPETNKDVSVSLIPTNEFLIHPKGRAILLAFMSIFMVLVILVLLIACANVANLLLARTATRKREIAIRMAMGSSRWRLIRQLLTESTILSLIGGTIGLLLALWANQLIMTFKPPLPIPISIELGLNLRILAFTVVLSTLTGIVFGLAPALHAIRPELIPLLKDDTGKGGFKKSYLRNTLIVTQIALSLILLIAAGLLARSLDHAQSIDPGFQTQNRLSFMVVSEGLKYPNDKVLNTWKDVAQRLGSTPGVAAVSFADNLPLGLSSNIRGILIDGYDIPKDQDSIYIDCSDVGPDYFRTMGISLLQGREFTWMDNAKSPRVAVINEAMAAKYWPNENPVGKSFRLHSEESDKPSVEIVGVVKTGKYKFLSEQERPYAHFALLQDFRPQVSFVVQTEGSEKPFFSLVRSLMKDVDDNIPILTMTSMDHHLDIILLPQRLGAAILGFMGVIALLLATIGIYGVMSYTVSQRTQEIGIRMALGARCGDVLSLIIKQGMLLLGIGLAIGLVVSASSSHFLSNLLYGMGALDPVTFIGVTLFLTGVALLACYIPARRAARTDPMKALHYE